MSAILERSPAARRGAAPHLVQGARRLLRGGLTALFVTTASLAGAGCTSTAPPAASAAERTGVSAALQTALDDVDLDGKQRASAQTIIDETRATLAPVHAERQRAAAAIADKIAAGTLTHADIETAVDAVAKAEQVAMPVIRDAAGRLHGVLDADQRAELIDAVRDAFRDSWRSEGAPRARLKALAKEMELTETQQNEIRQKAKLAFKPSMPALRHKMRAAREQLKEAAEAFESDDFDASAFAPSQDGLAARRDIMTAALRVVQASLPTLTPVQRGKLADFVRAHAGTVR